MAVKIRLKRLGKIRAPYYRIVVGRLAHQARRPCHRRDRQVPPPPRSPRSSRSTPSVPSTGSSVGAQPTEQVRALLKLTGDWGQFKGDKNADLDREDAAKRSPAFEIDSSKKSVVKPKAEKKAEAVEAPAAERRADEAAADDRRVIRCSPPRSNTVVKGIVDHPDDVPHRLVHVAARRRPRGARPPR